MVVMASGLSPGLRAGFDHTVTEADTAAALGSGLVPVPATPWHPGTRPSTRSRSRTCSWRCAVILLPLRFSRPGLPALRWLWYGLCTAHVRLLKGAGHGRSREGEGHCEPHQEGPGHTEGAGHEGRDHGN